MTPVLGWTPVGTLRRAPGCHRVTAVLTATSSTVPHSKMDVLIGDLHLHYVSLAPSSAARRAYHQGLSVGAMVTALPNQRPPRLAQLLRT